MFLKLDAKLVFIIYFITNLSHGFIILKLVHLSDPAKLSNNKIVNNLNNNSGKSLKQPFLNKKHDLLNTGNYKNKILVKRIIPHGFESTRTEYDYKYDTLYKPLVRIHKRKEDMNKKNPFIIPQEPEFKNFKATKITNDKIDRELIAPFKITQSKIGKNEFDILKKLEEIIENIDSRTKRLKAYDKVIAVLQNMLRSPQFEKSGEDNDPLAPGKIILPEEKEVVADKPKVWLPHYPPWNYWTYKKTIHQDECPASQVKIGNMCIWVPPH